MPDKHQIEFVIKPDGTVEEKVTGVVGPDCEDITQAIEKKLGKVTKRERTSDYYNSSQSTDDSVTTNT